MTIDPVMTYRLGAVASRGSFKQRVVGPGPTRPTIH
jgi:hypothetical protein